MKGRILLLCILLAGVPVLSAPSVEAAISVGSADGLFYMDPLETNFNLLNWENLNNVDGSVDPATGRPTITLGDTLRGIMSVSHSYAAGQPDRLPSGFELTALFEAQVIGINIPVGDPTNAAYQFGPPVVGSAFETAYGPGAMVALFEDHTPDFNPAAATVPLAEATATDSDTGLPYVVLGAAPGAVWGTSYYWASIGPWDILQVPANATVFSGVLEVLTNNSGVVFLMKEQEAAPVGWNVYKAPAWPTAGVLASVVNDFSIKGSVTYDGIWTDGSGGNPLDGIVQPGELSGGAYPAYDLHSTDPAQTHAIPEPLSVLVWAGLLGLVGLACRRRRARSA